MEPSFPRLHCISPGGCWGSLETHEVSVQWTWLCEQHLKDQGWRFQPLISIAEKTVSLPCKHGPMVLEAELMNAPAACWCGQCGSLIFILFFLKGGGRGVTPQNEAECFLNNTNFLQTFHFFENKRAEEQGRKEGRDNGRESKQGASRGGYSCVLSHTSCETNSATNLGFKRTQKGQLGSGQW